VILREGYICIAAATISGKIGCTMHATSKVRTSAAKKSVGWDFPISWSTQRGTWREIPLRHASGARSAHRCVPIGEDMNPERIALRTSSARPRFLRRNAPAALSLRA